MSKLGSRDPGKFQLTARFSAVSSFAVQRQRFHVKFATHLPARFGITATPTTWPNQK
jgi:hypothetical protein